MNFRFGNAKGDTASICCTKLCVKRRVMRIDSKPKDSWHGSDSSLNLWCKGLAGTKPCFSIFQTWRIDFKAIYITCSTERNEICSFGKSAQASILCKFKAFIFVDSLYVGSMPSQRSADPNS